MSFQPPQQQQGPPQQQGPQPTPEALKEQRFNELLEQVLGGELPGAGYLFAASPEERQKNLVKTTPENARDTLLRAVETCASDALMPYGAVQKGELAKAALAFSQAYLLLDPGVDESGVPVGAGAVAQGEGQEGAARAQAEGQIAAQEHQHQLNLELEAHKAALAQGTVDPESFKRAAATGGHQEPPRVQPNAREKAIEEEGKPKSDVLKGARADRPLPRPRVGS